MESLDPLKSRKCSNCVSYDAGVVQWYPFSAKCSKLNVHLSIADEFARAKTCEFYKNKYEKKSERAM